MPAAVNVHEEHLKATSRAMVSATWDDVPHLDTQAKAEMLAETPEWVRDARSKGIPSMGAGRIFPLPEDVIKVQPFPIPHYWPRCFALDVGWNWTAALFTAFDLDNGVKYHYGEYLAGKELPSVHAGAIKARGGDWIPGVIDPSADNRGQRDGERIMADYVAAGLTLTKADNSVQSGLVQMWQDLQFGQTKVFSTLIAFFEEYRLYHRDANGKIVKKKDHLIDCARYTHNSGRQVAIPKPRLVAGPTTTSIPNRGSAPY